MGRRYEGRLRDAPEVFEDEVTAKSFALSAVIIYIGSSFFGDPSSLSQSQALRRRHVNLTPRCTSLSLVQDRTKRSGTDAHLGTCFERQLGTESCAKLCGV